MIDWKGYTLGEIGRIEGGGTPSSKIEILWDGDISWITPADLSGYQFKYISKGARNISELGLRKSSAKLHPKNTVLMTSRAPIGYIALAKSPLATNQGFQSVICNKDIADFNFVYYYLKAYTQGIALIASGATFPEVSKSKLNKYKIKLPSLLIQKNISGLLSNYDDLIENNLKRIELLEEFARLIYEKWFLRFEISDHKFDLDQITGLPFNWKKIKIKDYVAIISKGPSLNYDLGETEGVEVLNQSCIRNGEIELEKVLIAKELNENKKTSYLKINDILINSMGDGTLGRVSKNVSIDTKMIIHNCITFLRAKDIYSQYMLYYFISAHQEYFESIAQGSTGQSTLKKELVSDLSITLPDVETIKAFDSKISPIWREIGNLKKQNKLLGEVRDILLPRLMTCVIDTNKMDIAA